MKKVLIVTYYWPPSGGIGVNRCLKFARYLRQFNWEPVIFTAKNADYPYIDYENLKQVPKNVEIHKVKVVEPFRLFKLFSGRKGQSMTNPVHVRNEKAAFIDALSIWIRGNFFIPDARSLWIQPSVRYLSKYLKNNKIDAILSDGPPHTNTVIACRISKKFDIPWLADFQDPWTQVDYYRLLKLTPWADKKHRKMEQEVFQVAKKITIASPTWKKELESIGAKNVSVVYWGYDEADFKELIPAPDKKFTIFHAGMLGFDRHPGTLLKILGELKRELDGFGENLIIKLAGFVDYSIVKSIKENGLEDNFENMGTISRKEALQHTINARVLLLLINKAENAAGRIPGKLFELMRAGNPLLCLGPEGSDVEEILKSSEIGIYAEYDHKERHKTFIKESYQNFRNKNQDRSPIKDITKYSNEYLVGKLSQYLEMMVKEPKN